MAKPLENTNGHRGRVKDKFARLGNFDSFTSYEVLELLLFYAIPRKDTKPIAKNLINVFGSLKGVLEADINTLAKQPGIGISTAILLRSFSQVGAYISAETAESVRGSGDLGRYAAQLTSKSMTEEFFVIALSPKNEIINHRKIATGSFSEVSADVREIIRFALESNCDRIALMHNHTNGILTPSSEDILATAKIQSVLAPLKITLVDHFITYGGKFVSFADSSVLKKEEFK